ncbi:hypothetical protein AYO21_04972 [Fonsecaea monophora]|uniref:Uncharacterized protein n=1 Tax=Fonsecaea monophora TaxID=254056 RepID=A0A177F9H8_9EURO|nr:hypothetical protein AYO21_04972 [Fonsecaea monophora]OAG40895.1 hypothetical protein AYO21_04972 [Fonsecaea monophora]
MDVTVDSSIEATVAQVTKVTSGTLYFLVNNAGRGLTSPLLYVDLIMVREVFDLNLLSALYVTQKFAPCLVGTKIKVINIGSIGGSVVTPYTGNFIGTDNISGLSDNARYTLHPPRSNDDADELSNWKGNQSDNISPPFLALSFGKHMYSPQGWIAGSSNDSDICDIQLAKDYTSGVSRRYFRIDVNPTAHSPRLTVISRNPIQIHDDGHSVILSRGESLEIGTAVTVDLGEATLRAWRPILSHREELDYRRNAEEFSRAFLHALPRFPISLNVPEGSTFDLRLGNNGTVFRRVRDGHGGVGGFVTVLGFFWEYNSQKIFAAKVPHFKASDPSSVVRKRWES